jgi:PBP1b-binding outer membrane lipoprotein LpoB
MVLFSDFRKTGLSILALMAIALFAMGCQAMQTSSVNDTPGYPVREIAPDQPGEVAGTGPESQDLIGVSDKMVRSILAIPEIASATTAPRVALLPVTNNSRFPINKNIFLKRMKAYLNSHARGRVVFLARDKMDDVLAERELKRQGLADDAGAPRTSAPRAADYFLTGSLDGMGQAGAQGTSDYILYTFKLVNAETSEEVWEDMVEIKKQGFDDIVYR